MIFGSLKKWEIVALVLVAAAAVIFRALDETGVLKVPFLPVMIALMIFAAGLLLWRTFAFLIDFAKLKKSGCRATARVVEYRTERTSKGSVVNEIIQYKDENGKKCRKSVDGTFMPSRKIGREYTLYYDPKNEDKFFLSPQCFISMWIDIGFAALVEGIFTAVLLMNTW